MWQARGKNRQKRIKRRACFHCWLVNTLIFYFFFVGLSYLRGPTVDPRQDLPSQGPWERPTPLKKPQCTFESSLCNLDCQEWLAGGFSHSIYQSRPRPKDPVRACRHGGSEALRVTHRTTGQGHQQRSLPLCRKHPTSSKNRNNPNPARADTTEGREALHACKRLPARLAPP